MYLKWHRAVMNKAKTSHSYSTYLKVYALEKLFHTFCSVYIYVETPKNLFKNNQ